MLPQAVRGLIRYLLRSTWRRKLPPSSCKSRRSPIWRAHEQTSAFSRAKKPAHTCLTKALEGIGVSARRESPQIDTETLVDAGYRIITGAGNPVTTVTAGRHISITFRTVRPVARTHSRRHARSESRAVHWDLDGVSLPEGSHAAGGFPTAGASNQASP